MLSIYHATVRSIGDSVILKPSYGRFGEAVYFSDNIEYVKEFGDVVYKSRLQGIGISVDYKDLINFVPDLNIWEEEGLTNLRDYLPANIDTVIMNYGKNDCEIIVYKSIEAYKLKKGRD